MPSKSFGVGSSPDAPRKEPITFDLQGFNSKREPIEPITFTCVEDLQGVALTDVVRAFKAGEMESAIKISGFIRDCLMDEDVIRFDHVTQSKDIVVKIETLGEIMEWLMEEYGERPTQKSSGLQGGQLPTPPISTASTGSKADPTLASFLPGASSTSPTQPSPRISVV